jgi:hypothetical protein
MKNFVSSIEIQDSKRIAFACLQQLTFAVKKRCLCQTGHTQFDGYPLPKTILEI